jgi:hypothetical protein
MWRLKGLSVRATRDASLTTRFGHPSMFRWTAARANTNLGSKLQQDCVVERQG